MVNDNQYISDSPSGYNVIQLDSDINRNNKDKVKRNKINKSKKRDWDAEGEAAMEEDEYKEDSPAGYDDTKLRSKKHKKSHAKNKHHHGKKDWSEEHSEHMDEK